MEAEPVFVVLAFLTFEDGSGSAMEIARGERCKAAADLVPAVSYSGDKKLRDAKVGIMLATEFDSFPFED
jgi:hypothetical protein